MMFGLSVACLFAFGVFEFFRPCRPWQFPRLRRRLSNFMVWFINLMVIGLILAPGDATPWGFDPILGFVAGFLFLDLLIYAIHRTEHAVPLLWRLHALHHSDPELDVTSSVRHHPVEAFGSAAIGWATIYALGIPGWVVGAHAFALTVLAGATHGNITWPHCVERLLQPVIATRAIHLVHHSAAPEHHNSNYGAVLCIWDRLFGTLRRVDEPGALRFGISELSAERCLGLIDQLATPWRIK